MQGNVGGTRVSNVENQMVALILIHVLPLPLFVCLMDVYILNRKNSTQQLRKLQGNYVENQMVALILIHVLPFFCV